MRERDIERYFIKRIVEAGGLQRKFTSPGRKGVPDRLVVFRGDVYFVELKAPGKFLRDDQIREHEHLRKAGAKTLVVDSLAAVDYFVDYILL